MSVTFYRKSEDSQTNVRGKAVSRSVCGQIEGSSSDLVIGLLNNMPDAALRSTERQFQNLLSAASTGISVRLVLCRMPSVPRSEWADAYLQRSYVDIDSVLDSKIDGLIVTGREPLKADLREEPYWNSFVRILEWSRDHTSSAIWSCLAAHAAVLHMDGIQRERSVRKHCGVFNCSRTSDHHLMSRLPENFRMPHSRWNGLPKDELAHCGYEVLSHAGDAGVDCFLRHEAGESLFLFFQGHPEYQPDTLLLEYRRDVLRYLRGEAASWPDTPHGMLAPKDQSALLEIRSEANALPEEETLARLMELFSTATIGNRWEATATTIYRNWLEYLAVQKAYRGGRREPAVAPLKEAGIAVGS